MTIFATTCNTISDIEPGCLNKINSRRREIVSMARMLLCQIIFISIPSLRSMLCKDIVLSEYNMGHILTNIGRFGLIKVQGY
jgi:NRPS condensation-like uncharacterized protein